MLATTSNMRSGGLGYERLPLFVWAIAITAVLLLLSLPVLAGEPLIVPASIQIKWIAKMILKIIFVNLAVFWDILINIYLGQSAGNLTLYTNVEIFREYTPEVICLTSIYIKNKRFKSYISGLVEGNGAIIVPLKERSDKGKLNYPSIQIVFALKDLPLALIIQKTLGHGSVSRKKGSNAYIFTINDKKGIIKMIHILNGEMKTPKINALYRLIEWTEIKGEKVHKLPLNNDPLYESAWLSGIIEADGHFGVRATTSSQYPKVECKFEFSQSRVNHFGMSQEPFMNLISKFLQTSVKSIRSDSKHPQYRLRTLNKNSNMILVNYLNKYPLFGSKHLDFLDFNKVLNLFNPKFKANQTNIKKVLEIKSGMNDKRTIITWEHLNNFYNLDY